MNHDAILPREGSASFLPAANGYDEKIAESIIKPPTVNMNPSSMVVDMLNILSVPVRVSMPVK